MIFRQKLQNYKPYILNYHTLCNKNHYKLVLENDELEFCKGTLLNNGNNFWGIEIT